jgi:hypothetical protein
MYLVIQIRDLCSVWNFDGWKVLDGFNKLY